MYHRSCFELVRREKILGKKLVDEIETKYVFRNCWSLEGKIISIVSTLKEDLKEKERERESWMKLKRKACFVERSRALVGIIKLNRSFRTC